MERNVIETSVGAVWITAIEQTGELRVWWPPRARVGEFAVEVLRGRAKWDQKSRGWYVPPAHRDTVCDDLEAI